MRITISMVDSISRTETEKKFKDVIEKLEDQLVSEIEKEVKKQAESIKIPQYLIDELFIRQSNDVKVDFSNGDKESYDLKNHYPIRRDSYRFEIAANAKIKDLRSKLTKTNKEKDAFYSDIRKVLFAYSSHKALIAAVPEFAIYFKDEDKAKSMAIVPMEKINEVRKNLVRP